MKKNKTFKWLKKRLEVILDPLFLTFFFLGFLLGMTDEPKSVLMGALQGFTTAAIFGIIATIIGLVLYDRKELRK